MGLQTNRLVDRPLSVQRSVHLALLDLERDSQKQVEEPKVVNELVLKHVEKMNLVAMMEDKSHAAHSQHSQYHDRSHYQMSLDHHLDTYRLLRAHLGMC